MNVQEQLSADQEEIAVHKRALVIMQSGILEDCGACFVETCHIKFDAPVGKWRSHDRAGGDLAVEGSRKLL